jgi:hypothetical protein
MTVLTRISRFPATLSAAYREIKARRAAYRFRSTQGPHSGDIAGILDSLETTGLHLTSLDKLRLPSIPAFLESTRTLCRDLCGMEKEESRKSYVIRATENQILSHPALLLFGLEEFFLGIAKAYIGGPVAYRGLTFRRDLADGQEMETRLWHKDSEDYRILKVIVYANDVDAEGGPFEYISKRDFPRFKRPRSDNGRIQDEDMEGLVPKSKWIPCTGPAGTVIIADTCGIYHRGRVPTKDRFAIFQAYNSTTPRKPHYCQPLFPREDFLSVSGPLSENQKEALAYRY